MSSTLFPRDPEDHLTLYHLIRAEMSRTVVGHEGVVRRLAMLGVEHLAGQRLCRALLIGPPGSGKTTLARALAEALCLPYLIIRVEQMSEQNWTGSDLSDYLRTLSGPGRGGKVDPRRAAVILDEMDKIRLMPGETGPSASYHVGKQQSVLGLWEGAEVVVTDGGATWDSSRMMVIGCGVFEELEAERPSSGDLTEWGYVPELSERIARGRILRVETVSGGDLDVVLYAGLAGVEATYRRWGYALEVSRAALLMVRRRLESGIYDAGVRAGIGWLVAGAEEALIRLIEREAEPGTRHILTPDDLEALRPPQARWHDQ